MRWTCLACPVGAKETALLEPSLRMECARPKISQQWLHHESLTAQDGQLRRLWAVCCKTPRSLHGACCKPLGRQTACRLGCSGQAVPDDMHIISSDI